VKKIINSIIAGILIGLLLYHHFLRPSPKTVTRVVETVTTDTVYVRTVDTVTINRTQIRHEFLRDTVYLGVDMPINSFGASYSHLYGNIYVNGQVMGEVLSMALKTDFRIPSVTNNITRTETIIKKPQGIYLGAGISNFSASVGGVYLNDRNLFQYSYYPQINGHSVSYFRKVF